MVFQGQRLKLPIDHEGGASVQRKQLYTEPYDSFFSQRLREEMVCLKVSLQCHGLVSMLKIIGVRILKLMYCVVDGSVAY